MSATPGERVRPWEVLTLMVLVGIGAVARLGHALASGLWRDEALALDIATLPTSGAMIDFLVRHESHPPLFYLLLRGWTTIAGSTDSSVVVPGILLGLLTIVAMWWLTLSVATPTTALVAAAFAALSPSMIQNDAMVRPYALLQVLLVVAAGCLWTALSRGSRPALTGWVLASVALLYIHNWTALAVAGMTVMASWFIVRGHSRLSLFALLAAAAAIAVSWLPWLPSLWYQIEHGGHLPPGKNPLFLLPLQLGLLVPGLPLGQGVILWAAMGAVVFLRRRKGHVKPGLAAFLVGGVVAAMLLATVGSYVTNLLISHTVPMLAPSVLVATAIVLADLPVQGRILARFSVVVLLSLSALGAAQLAVTPRSNAALIAHYLNASARPGDLVLVVPVYVASSVLRYYRGPAPLEGYPHGAVASPLGFDDRVSRETTSELLQERWRDASRTLKLGGSVWVISNEAPKHLRESWRFLEAELERLAGPPLWIVAARSKLTMEHLDLRRFTGPSAPLVR